MNKIPQLLAAVLLAGCTTSGAPQEAQPVSASEQRRGIAGEWRMQADDTITTCRLVIGPGGGRGQGSADEFGCIGSNAFEGFLRRWERDGNRIVFYSFGADGPVARVRRVSADEFRGRFIPSGRTFTLKRR